MKFLSLSDVAGLPVTQFATTEVLSSKVQIADRKNGLLRAMLLNYQEHQPVNIYFRNKVGELVGMECSVIAVSDEHIMLRSGIVIPVKSILLIDLL